MSNEHEGIGVPVMGRVTKCDDDITHGCMYAEIGKLTNKVEEMKRWWAEHEGRIEAIRSKLARMEKAVSTLLDK